MIEIAPNYILRFIEYLNEEYPSKSDCYVTFYQGQECIKYLNAYNNDCETFAEYSPTTKIMHVPTQYPTNKNPRFLLESIAHEYWHHIQNDEGRLNNEDRGMLEKEAEEMGIKIVDKYFDV